MKKLLLACILFFPAFGYSMDLKKPLHKLPIVGHVLAKKTLKKEMKKFWSNPKNVQELTLKIQKLASENPQDLRGIYEILVQLFGKEVADIIMMLSNIQEIQDHLKHILTSWPLLFEPETCPKALSDITEGLVFVGTYAAVYAFAPQAYWLFAGPAASIAAKAAGLILDVTDVPEKVCSKINKEDLFFEREFI